LLLIGVASQRKARWARGHPRGRPLLSAEGQRGYHGRNGLGILGEVQKGYIPDATYGGVVLGTWVEGEVETGFLGAIKLKGKTRRTITTYRAATPADTWSPMPLSSGLKITR
jgi:hypothetical protein